MSGGSQIATGTMGPVLVLGDVLCRTVLQQDASEVYNPSLSRRRTSQM